MMRSGLVLWLLAVLVWGEEDPVTKTIRTLQGSVRGYKLPGDSVFEFYGIPYATTPLGPHKFKAPFPAPAWFSVFDAVNKGTTCPQATIGDDKLPPHTSVIENCLVANVFVPDTEEKKLPVLVYIHGGAFQVGSGGFADPKPLVRSKKVIVVTFNYRLGIHGFLCLGTNDAPGNAGMKDQLELLRWVRKNIGSYGGNPKDVTIAGFGAGASAVDLLVLSPAAKGLFHKAILESGSSLAPWTIQVNPLENAKNFAKSAGLEKVENVYALEEFYKTASFEVLTSTGGFYNNSDGSLIFLPCVEIKTSEKAFLLDNPYNILNFGKYNKVPMLYGFGDFGEREFSILKDKMNSNFYEFLPVDVNFESNEEREELSDKIKVLKFYFGDKPVSQGKFGSHVSFMSDVYYTYPTIRTVNLYVEASHENIFLYEYNFVKDSAPKEKVHVKGSALYEQTLTGFDEIQLNQKESKGYKLSEEMKSTIREIYINFIKTGTPVPEDSSLPAWPATGKDGSPRMSFGEQLELLDTALLEDRVRLWDTIYEHHYRAPQPPPTPPIRHTEL